MWIFVENLSVKMQNAVIKYCAIFYKYLNILTNNILDIKYFTIFYLLR